MLIFSRTLQQDIPDVESHNKFGDSGFPSVGSAMRVATLPEGPWLPHCGFGHAGRFVPQNSCRGPIVGVVAGQVVQNRCGHTVGILCKS